MTLLTIVQNPLNEIGNTEVPSSIVGNSNLTATQALALANRALKQVSKDVKWPGLSLKATINTVGGQTEYALPADFKSIVDQTVWNTSNRRRLRGGETAVDWALLNSWSTTNTITMFYRIFRSATSNGNVMQFYPPAQDGQVITYEYISNALTADSLGALQEDEFLSDTDVAVLNEDLIALCFKWRWLKAKGFPYAEEMRDYEETVAYERAATGSKVIDMGSSRLSQQRIIAVPDGGYGQ